LITRLDHVAVCVRDPRPAAQLWGELLGGRFVQGVPDWRGFSFIQFEYPNGSRLEIISPASDRTGFAATFLARRGEGLHHVTFMTDDLAVELERLRGTGYRVVDEDYADPQWQEAFLSPSSAHGVLVQLAQSSLTQEEQDARWGGEPLEKVLELAARFA
jgi:catechol 2,3-dioxygenase-like lactoylglutathione lyase family enzyme